jgi:hypothetical protein
VTPVTSEFHLACFRGAAHGDFRCAGKEAVLKNCCPQDTKAREQAREIWRDAARRLSPASMGLGEGHADLS